MIKPKNIRKLSLFLIIIQSIGIRYFNGIGIILILIICIANIRNFPKLTSIRKPLVIITLMFTIASVCLFKDFSVVTVAYILGTMFAALLSLISYNNTKANFIDDLLPILWFFAVYGFISWTLLIFIPNIFVTVSHGLKYSTFLYLLINSAPKDTVIPRLSSLFWEPGCCQFILNFLLVILVTRKEKLSKIIFVSFLTLATQSTTGYINFIAVIVLYAFVNKRNLLPIVIFGSIVLSLGTYSLVSSNISSKFANSSGMIRTRDLYVGYNLTKNHPIMGVDTENLDNNKEAQVLEDEIWGGSHVWTNSQGYFAGGYTNGFWGAFLDYGLLLGLLLYWSTLKAPIIWNNRGKINPYCFYVIYFCSLTGEPISRTSLFFFFAFSYIVNQKENKGRKCRLHHSSDYNHKLELAK